MTKRPMAGRPAARGAEPGPQDGGPAPADPLQAGSPLRTPRAAAVAGIIFSVLLIVALVLFRISTPTDPSRAGTWLTDSGRRTAVTVSLNLIPFVGIAFLWFVGVIRDRIGRQEDRFFATVFLGSGLLFVGMLFVAAAVGGGLATAASPPGHLPGSNTLLLNRNITSTLLNVYTVRMAAVFTLVTVTIARRTGTISRWIIVTGTLAAVVLLVGSGISPWVQLLFPAWVLALSLDILLRRPPDQQPGRASANPGDGPRTPARHPLGPASGRPSRKAHPGRVTQARGRPRMVARGAYADRSHEGSR